MNDLRFWFGVYLIIGAWLVMLATGDDILTWLDVQITSMLTPPP
jgi:hypothetical protein